MLILLGSIFSYVIDYYLLTRVAHIDSVTSFRFVGLGLVLSIVLLVLSIILQKFYDSLFVVTTLSIPMTILAVVIGGLRMFVIMNYVFHFTWHNILFVIVINSVKIAGSYFVKFKKMHDVNVQIILEQNKRSSSFGSRLL